MMNNKEFKLYIKQIKEQFLVDIEDSLVEKDYILSLFLSFWAKEETPHLDKLIFKGGTLLTKNFLNYHRISEDLDFIHQDCNVIRNLPSKNQKESHIKQRILPIIDELVHLAKLSKLDFIGDRTNTRYVIQRNSRSLYVFNLYYTSRITNLESFIKFEISFVEDLLFDSSELTIKNIVDYIPLNEFTILQMLTNYNLLRPTLQVYSMREIILEKIRATITREQFKPRDVFDLYLLHLKDNGIFLDKELIFQKLDASPFKFEDIIQNIAHFVEEEISVDLDDIYNLSLIEFNEEDLIQFSTQLINYLKEISEEYLRK